jgi:hypothetical protein
VELNQKAYEVASCFYRNNRGPAEIIIAYLEACNEKPKPIPFDASLVKPGDEVAVKTGIYALHKYIGVTKKGRVVVEAYDGIVSVHIPEDITIPPKTRKTVRVKVFKHPKTLHSYIVHEDSWSYYEEWKAISESVEIEVTE